MLRILYPLLLLVILSPAVLSQSSNRTISGLVTSSEDGAPLEGVQITARGSGAVSGTQQDGMYYIQVTGKDSILVFSREGFASREVRLTGTSDYNIQLGKGQPATVQATAFSPFGSWRTVFQVRPDVGVPVVFDIHKDKNGVAHAFFHNAEERFDGGRVEQTGDSLFIHLDQFDNELAFHIEEGVLTGVLRRQDKTGNVTPVKAFPGDSARFPGLGAAPASDITGTYDISFISGNGKEEKAVGIFKQEGSHLRATFLRVTGDARYLEGVVEGSQFRLSSFIGSGPSYYEGSFTAEHHITGENIGARGSVHFTGLPDDKAALPDPYKLTLLKDGAFFDFSFPDADGRQVSLHDKKFRNKVVIVTIGGTWCPNCVDETVFLAPWYEANRKRGVEVVSIQYERQTDPAYVKKVLTRFREKYHIQYDQVFGGLADKQRVAQSLPSLNTFLAFPTTLIIDKKGKVARIHTGYSGPATGVYYDEFVKEFNQEIDGLL